MIYVDETINGTTTHTPYIYLGLDEDGNARILRQYAERAKRMNSTAVASYSGCEADLWLENTTDGFLSRFDEETLDALVNTTIRYTDFTLSADGTAQVVAIPRRCFPLSYTEEGWTATSAGSEGRSYLPALKAFYLSQHPDETTVTDNAARIGYRQDNGTAVNVWMRSAFSTSYFRYVGNDGSAYGYSAASTVFWLRPALSVAPATSVSDEGADIIFLLPEGRRTYWGAVATVSVGQSSRRPLKAKLIVDADPFFETHYWVCNNYADTTPTWVECTNGGMCELGDTKTADRWEIGVKMDVRGSSPTYSIGEPVVLVELEGES